MFYGSVSLLGVPVTEGTIEAHINDAPEVFLTYEIGSTPNASNYYGIVVPIDSVEPQEPNTARNGDKIEFFLDGDLVGRATLGDRGLVHHLDLDKNFNDLDLKLLLIDAADPVTAGDSSNPLVYTATVTNSGPNATTPPSAKFTQTLPAGVTFVSATSSGGGSCSEASGTVTCILPALASLASDTVTVTVNVPASAAQGAVLDSTATVSNEDTTQSDPDLGNNGATASTTVQRKTDLVASFVSTSPDPAEAGQQLTYRIRAENVGPSTATGVGLVYTLPTGTQFVSVSNTTECAHAAGVLSCAFGGLAPTGSSTVDVVVEVAANASGNLLSNAVVSGTETDPVSPNNTATSNIAISRKADLSVQFTAGASTPVDGGSTLTYQLRLENLGASDATGVILTQSLPPVANAQFVSVSPPANCSHAAGVVTCNFPALALNTTQDVAVAVHISSNTTTTQLSSTAHVDANETDSVPGNDDATAITSVRSANLLLTQSASPTPAVAGATLTYALNLTNLGPDTARNVKLTDVLPTNASFVSGTLSSAPKLYTVSSTTSRLKTVNPATGETQSSVGITLPGQIVRGAYGLAANPWTGELWAALKLEGQLGHELVRLDRTTGVATSVGDTFLELAGLAFDSQANLYAVTGDTGSGAESLYSLDPATGVPTFLMSLLSSTPGEVLASERGSDLLYHLSGAAGMPDSVLETLDPQDLTFSSIPPTGTAYGAPMALTQEMASSSFFFADATPKLYRITEQGLVSELASLDHGVSGLAYAPLSSCHEAAGTVTCELGGVQSGDSLTLNLVVRVNEAASGTLTNVVSASARESDNNLANNTNLQLVTPITRQSDLLALVADVPDPVIAGQSLAYEMTVQNVGPSSANGAQARLTLPANTTFSSASSGCTNAAGVVTCVLGNLSANQSSPLLTIHASVAPTVAHGATLTAAVDASATEPDPNSANDAFNVLTSVIRQTDLLASFTGATPDPVKAGSNVVYQLQARNNGSSQASGVQLTQTLPANTAFVGATGLSCSHAAGVVTCNVGSMSPSQTSTASITATVASSVASGAQLSSSLQVSGTEQDPNAPNNTATRVVDVVRETGLSAQFVSVTPDPATAGDNLVYQFRASNAGPSDGSGITLALALPAQTQFVSASTGCTPSGQTVTCTVGQLVSGANQTASVTAKVPASTLSGAILNASATVDGTEPDPNSANDTAQSSVSVARSSDVAVTHQTSPPHPVAGATLSYTLRVTNHGSSDASGVLLEDTLPAGVTFTASSGASCALIAPGSQTVRCVLGAMAAAATLDVTLSGTLASSALDDTVLTNTAQVSRTEPDPQPSNDTSTSQSVVNAEADLLLTQAFEPNAPVAGDGVTLRLGVQNLGHSDAQSVQLSDTLPSGVRFVSGAGCTEASGVVSCSLGTLASGASAEARIVGRLDEASRGTLTNTASASSIVFDPQGSNNTNLSLSTQLSTSSNLNVTLLSPPATVVAGAEYTYTAQVENVGPSQATGVELSEAWPAEVSFVSATPSAGTCSAANGTLTCSLGALASSGKATVVLKMKASASLLNGAALQDRVIASSEEPDPAAADNEALLRASIQTQADLDVSLTGAQSTRSSGIEVAYVATILNRGPSDAHEVELTDALPAGMTFVSGSNGCAVSSGVLHCPVGSLPIGERAFVSFQLALASSQATTVSNTVAVSSADIDPAAGNSTSTFELLVAPLVGAMAWPSIAGALGGILSLAWTARRRRFRGSV